MTGIFAARHAEAHAGDLDPSFGNGGIVILPALRPEAPFDTADAVAIQPDGKIIVAGRWGALAPGPTFAVARFNTDGTLDATFGFEGLVTLSSGFAEGDDAHALAIMADGRIVVAGNFGHYGGVYRLTPSGQLDTSFASTGAVVVLADGNNTATATINAVTLDGFGGTYFAGTSNASGHSRFLLGWLGTDGTVLVAASVDLGFGDLDQTATSLVRQADGEVVVAGYADLSDQSGYASVYCAAARFEATVLPTIGFSPDAGYGDGGTEFFSIGSGAPTNGCFIDALTLLPDGSTLAGGREPLTAGGWTGMYARLDDAGQIDRSAIETPQFTPWGDNSVRRIVLQDDGKPVLVGFTGVDETGLPGPFAARLLADGSGLDATYGANGVSVLDFDTNDFASGQVLGAAIDTQGRVVMAGLHSNGASNADGSDETQIMVARFQGDASDVIFACGFD